MAHVLCDALDVYVIRTLSFNFELLLGRYFCHHSFLELTLKHPRLLRISNSLGMWLSSLFQN
jgi:hypothetical protein